MCTVTIVDLPECNGFRLACNRDESPNRPQALPPDIRKAGNLFYLMPVDPLSGGTWIAGNQAGLVITLLNVNPVKDRYVQNTKGFNAPSRGVIIPALMQCCSAESAMERAKSLICSDFLPFRLIITDRNGGYELRVTGDQKEAAMISYKSAPLMFTSSGLGDCVVEKPRRILFDEWFSEISDITNKQDAFHRHSWSDRKEISICMRRHVACTVSFTAIEVNPEKITMTYLDGPPDTDAPESMVALTPVGVLV